MPEKTRLWLASAVAILLFAVITLARLEGWTGALDNAVLQDVMNTRVPWLTDVALNVTALGSSVLVVWFSMLALLLLWGWRQRIDALHLLAAVMALDPFITLTKLIFHEPRPPEIERLVVAPGFSYPSGHSLSAAVLYLTIGLIVSRQIRDSRPRVTVFVAAGIVIVLVGISRIYLAAHYVSDVAGGLALGAAWALGLAALFTRRHHNAIE